MNSKNMKNPKNKRILFWVDNQRGYDEEKDFMEASPALFPFVFY